VVKPKDKTGDAPIDVKLTEFIS